MNTVTLKIPKAPENPMERKNGGKLLYNRVWPCGGLSKPPLLFGVDEVMRVQHKRLLQRVGITEADIQRANIFQVLESVAANGLLRATAHAEHLNILHVPEGLVAKLATKADIERLDVLHVTKGKVGHLETGHHAHRLELLERLEQFIADRALAALVNHEVLQVGEL